MLNRFYRDILIRGFESGFKRRKTFAYWEELERSQWLPLSELKALQDESLAQLMRHAADTCPYYNRTWQELGLDPRRISAASDLQHWPIINRDLIRAHRYEMRSTAPD